MSARVVATPGWEVAVDAVDAYWKKRGKVGPPMGPVSADTWGNWLHIVSHTLEGEHGLAHAACELELVELVIDALGGLASSRPAAP